jgi:hypothetical protein
MAAEGSSMLTSPMTAAKPEPLVHREAGAARRLKVSESTLAKWRKAGTGPAFVMVGRFICYRDADLEDWLLSRRRFPSEARKGQSGGPADLRTHP